MTMRQQESTGITIRIPWDSNTVRGFVFALCLTTLWLLFGRFFEFGPTTRTLVENTPKALPDSLISMYLGDAGSGKGSKGNLVEEGRQAKGAPTKSNFDPASGPKFADKAATTKGINTTELSNKITPVRNVAEHSEKDKKKPTSDENASTQKNNMADNSSTSLKGDPNGSRDGSGLGDTGLKSGKGKGAFDFDFGGGNRLLTSQPSLSIPAGVNTSTRIQIRFRVSPSGDVVMPMPVKRGEPRLEQIALDAVRRMKFNRIEEAKGDMVGYVTVTFNIN